MDIQQVLSALESKFGKSFDTAKVTNMLKGMDLSKFSLNDIISKLSAKGLVGDLDGDGVQESLAEELKGKAEQMLGGFFHKK